MSPLESFLQAILLGAAAALAYDLLRPLRLRCPRLTAPADLLFALALGLGTFLFLLRRTQGELRAFLVVGGAGGWVLFRCLLSDALGPLWDFWAETLADFGRLLARPLRWTVHFCENKWKQAKSLFYFAEKCYTIKRLECDMAAGTGGSPMKSKQQRPVKPKKEHVHSSFATKILILALLAGAGFQLWHLSGQVSEARQQKEELALEVARMEQENAALTEDINQGATVDKMKELARSELDFVDPGEYVFEIIGAP